jgi:hypothetical protein
VNIRLHIERLVLDGRWQGLDRTVLARAVEEELCRLLGSGAPDPRLIASGAVAELRGMDLPEPAQQPEALGTQIATSLHRSIGVRGGGTA